MDYNNDDSCLQQDHEDALPQGTDYLWIRPIKITIIEDEEHCDSSAGPRGCTASGHRTIMEVGSSGGCACGDPKPLPEVWESPRRCPRSRCSLAASFSSPSQMSQHPLKSAYLWAWSYSSRLCALEPFPEAVEAPRRCPRSRRGLRERGLLAEALEMQRLRASCPRESRKH